MHSVAIKVDFDKLLDQKATSLVVGNFRSRGFEPSESVGRILDRAQKRFDTITFVDIDAHTAYNLVEEDKKVIDRYQGVDDKELEQLLEKHAVGDSQETHWGTGYSNWSASYDFSENYLEGLWNPQILKEYDPSYLPPKRMLDDIQLQLSMVFSPDNQWQAVCCDKKEPISEPALVLYCPLEGGEYVVDATVQTMAERFDADIQMVDLLQLAIDQWDSVWTDLIKPRSNWTMFAGLGYFTRYRTPDADKLKQLANQLFGPNAPKMRDTGDEPKKQRRIIYIRDFGIVATLASPFYAAILEAVQKTLPGSNYGTADPVPTAIILGCSPFLTNYSLFQGFPCSDSDSDSDSEAEVNLPPKKVMDPWGESDEPHSAREERNFKRYRSLRSGFLTNDVDSALLSTDVFSGLKNSSSSRYKYSRICVAVPTKRDPAKERMVRERIRLNVNLLQLRLALFYKAVGQLTGPEDLQQMARVFNERSTSRILTIHDMRPIYERAIEVATAESTNQPGSAVLVTWDNLANAQEAQDALEQERSNWVDDALPKEDKDSDKSGVDPIVDRVKAMDLDEYESNLINRIIKPGQLKTNFDSVHLPTETIDVIRSLVSLPLICPEAFQTGLLKEHNVTGALFFGPPGTGKTHLARAIAKESGSRMISVKPSDILNKWVGQSEKIVNALFTLARRLKPCIIFIDEIDSLFGSRSANDHSPWRNDLLTQFAQEMDGMYTSDVVVIGTTNRPFDIDDAMLRRLPCRILIDLPDQSAREAILKILLKEEQLESDIDLKELAKQTMRYSGSDLKNVCVMAAYESAKDLANLPWVTGKSDIDTEASDQSSSTDAPSSASTDSEEKEIPSDTPNSTPEGSSFEGEAKNTEPDTTEPKSRVLRKRHFDHALMQVQASTSDSQTSLAQLRRWNDVFGSANQREKVKIETLHHPTPIADRVRYLRNI